MLSDEWRYAQLSMLVEAWGFRASHARGHLLSREELALDWFHGEYDPVGAVAEADLGGPGTETERYLRVAMLRFLLLHTHEWSAEVLERLLGEMRSAARGRHDGAPVPEGDEVSAERPWADTSRPLAERVESLLAEMTLEEKLAQLVGVWVGAQLRLGHVAPMQEARGPARRSSGRARTGSAS